MKEKGQIPNPVHFKCLKYQFTRYAIVTEAQKGHIAISFLFFTFRFLFFYVSFFVFYFSILF